MFGLVKVNPKEPMRKGEKYRFVFKYSGELTETKAKEIVANVQERLKEHLKITRITFNDPEIKKVSVEGIAQHDPIPFLLIGGLILGIACLWGVRLALESVYRVVGVFTPNKILLLIILLGVPYLFFSGRLQIKGLRIKGVR